MCLRVRGYVPVCKTTEQLPLETQVNETDCRYLNPLYFRLILNKTKYRTTLFKKCVFLSEHVLYVLPKMEYSSQNEELELPHLTCEPLDQVTHILLIIIDAVVNFIY